MIIPYEIDRSIGYRSIDISDLNPTYDIEVSSLVIMPLISKPNKT